MAAELDLEYASGETIDIEGVIADNDRNPISIDGAIVFLVISKGNAAVATFTTDTPPGFVMNAEEGAYRFAVHRSHQIAAALPPGRYKYTIWAQWPDGQESEQNIGGLTLRAGPKQVVLA